MAWAVARCGPTGCRNRVGFELAQQLRDKGWPIRDANRAIDLYRDRVRCLGDHSYSRIEARRSVWSVYREPQRQPWATTEGAAP